MLYQIAFHQIKDTFGHHYCKWNHFIPATELGSQKHAIMLKNQAEINPVLTHYDMSAAMVSPSYHDMPADSRHRRPWFLWRNREMECTKELGQGSLCVWAQTTRDSITMYHPLSLSETLLKMIPGDDEHNVIWQAKHCSNLLISQERSYDSIYWGQK